MGQGEVYCVDVLVVCVEIDYVVGLVDLGQMWVGQFVFQWFDEWCEYIQYQCFVVGQDQVQVLVYVGVYYDWLNLVVFFCCLDLGVGFMCFFRVVDK